MDSQPFCLLRRAWLAAPLRREFLLLRLVGAAALATLLSCHRKSTVAEINVLWADLAESSDLLEEPFGAAELPLLDAEVPYAEATQDWLPGPLLPVTAEGAIPEAIGGPATVDPPETIGVGTPTETIGTPQLPGGFPSEALPEVERIGSLHPLPGVLPPLPPLPLIPGAVPARPEDLRVVPLPGNGGSEADADEAGRGNSRWESGDGPRSVPWPSMALPPTDTAGGRELQVDAAGTLHEVQPGETLFLIGRRHGHRPDAIAEENGLADPDRIVAGQRLRIPARVTGDGAAPDRTAAAEAEEHPPAIPALGMPTDIVARDETDAEEVFHEVQPGETVFLIGRTYGTPAEAIVAINQLENPDQIQAGQWLRIPAGGFPLSPESRRTPTALVAPVPSASNGSGGFQDGGDGGNSEPDRSDAHVPVTSPPARTDRGESGSTWGADHQGEPLAVPDATPQRSAVVGEERPQVILREIRHEPAVAFCQIRYTVQPTDTVASIARAHGISESDVLRGSDEKALYPGQVLLIPVQSWIAGSRSGE